MAHELCEPDIVAYYQAAHQKMLAGGVDKRYPNVNLVRLIARYFDRKDGRLLDYGCGFGSNTIHLLQQGYTVDAVDSSPYALEAIKQKLSTMPELDQHIQFKTIDAEHSTLPFEDNTFDYIVCASVLSLLSTKEKILALLQDFHRVIKPQGKLFLDINGPGSHFVKFAAGKIGAERYDYRGRSQQDESIVVFCPETAQEFAMLVRESFQVDEVGYTAHEFFEYAEQEFIVCAQKV